MSHNATTSVNGRVRSIKSKFENLQSIESLDIGGPTATTATATSTVKQQRPKSSFVLKRSATSLDLPERAMPSSVGALPLTGNVRRTVAGDTTRSGRSMEIQRQASDSFLFKNRNVVVRDQIKPLKEIKENVEVRLSRHTSDPVKRSSIKRSPAFRVGNGGAGGDKTAGKMPLTKTTSMPKEFTDKFDELLKRCAADDNDNHLTSAALTDSLKAALKQPLPAGPPPKKPPRTFETSSPKDDINPIVLFMPKTGNGNNGGNDCDDIDDLTAPAELKNKISYLEQNLVLNATTAKARANGGVNGHAAVVREKTHLLANSLLSCIPCSSPIYDTFSVAQQGNGLKAAATAAPPLTNGHHANGAAKVTTRNNGGGDGAEPIYMEPFSHLKMKKVATRADEIAPAIGGCSKPGDLDVSCSSCGDHQANTSDDIHYLCTMIQENINTSDMDTVNENEPTLTMKTTYDEINVLVNAAFGQQHHLHHRPSEGFSTLNSSDGGDNSSTTSSTSSQQQKSAIRVYRTLTEKRKDYVRRVSGKQFPVIDTGSPYGSLHRTFKPQVLKTFSLDDIDDTQSPHNNNNNHNNSRSGNEYDIPNSEEDGGECVLTDGKTISLVSDRTESATMTTSISQRIAKYNQMSTDATSPGRNEHNQSVSRRSTMMKETSVDGESSSAANDSHDDVVVPPKLFQVCLLIGYNTSTGQAYIKSKYPPDEDVPQNIEQLVFPSRKLVNQTKIDQEYSIILTDGNGYRIYGYCRRVLPESCEICLPLAYCMISEIKAPGFYFKVLQEIEGRHGQADVQANLLLESLQCRPIPDAGKFLHIKMPVSPKPKAIITGGGSHHGKVAPKRLSLEVNPKWLTEAQATANTDIIESTQRKDKTLTRNDDKKLDKSSISPPFDLHLINRSLIGSPTRGDELFVRRPNDLRLESTELSDLYAALGPELLIAVFGSLLLERKVILFGKHISRLSSCVLALQTVLYPFQWQHTLVTILPHELVEVCQAPFPVLAGMLEPLTFDVEDAIVINLDTKVVTQKCDDEATILPAALRDALKVSLDMVDLLDQGRMLSSVLIAEAFLRFFVELFAGYRLKHFDKKQFIDSHQSPTVRLFLEWFTETAMFRHFIAHKYAQTHRSTSYELATMQNNNMYDLFDARLLEKSENKTKATQNMENIMRNCRIINKKTKTFKERLRDFMNNGKKSEEETSK